MQKYSDVVLGQRSNFMLPVPNAQVTVLTSAGSVPATIYSDNGVTVTSNPIVTDATGRFSFYAPNGRYTLVIVYQTTTLTLPDIVLEDDPVNANASVVVGGTIDATPIGGTTPSSGSFTNLAASGTLTGFPGRLLNIQVFATPGASTYTPTTGTNKVVVTLVGGGGGGGGAGAAGASTASAAGGGAAGGYAKSLITSAFSGVTVTVGNGGAGGAAGANTGTAGGTTSFGALLSAAGGSAGLGVSAGSSTGIVSGPVAGGIGSGGNIQNSRGSYSDIPIIFGINNVKSGAGGHSFFGGGAILNVSITASTSTAGNNAAGYGSGGSGGLATSNGAAAAGGNGSSGIVIVEEYS